MVSRLCVKGLGPSIVEKDLIDLFSQKGEVTDARVMRAKSGRSRQFAFVGFRTESQAKEVMEYFNNTFLKSSRIVVEKAEKLTDKGSSMKGSKGKKRERDVEEAQETQHDVKVQKKLDKDKEEFMEVMKSRNKAKFWNNDVTDNVNEGDFDTEANDFDESADSDDEYNDMNESTPKEEAEDLVEIERDSSKKDGKNNLDSFIEALEARAEEGKKDKVDTRTSKKNRTKDAAPVEDTNDKNAQSEEEDCNDGAKTDNARLFVKNLPFTSSEDEVSALFGTYGTVKRAFALDPDTHSGRGLGYVEFGNHREAEEARSQLHGTSFWGESCASTMPR